LTAFEVLQLVDDSASPALIASWLATRHTHGYLPAWESGCVCGKVRFSEARAREALVTAKIRRGLRGNKLRREQRIYPCPGDVLVYHLTSLPAADSDTDSP
jgi:hypothetical protein